MWSMRRRMWSMRRLLSQSLALLWSAQSAMRCTFANPVLTSTRRLLSATARGWHTRSTGLELLEYPSNLSMWLLMDRLVKSFKARCSI
ncbi:uncharacterized protein LOC6566883 [Drosophila grimshawi]|uniref:uncharacterized protein LOC6566883 n=1 Tax=Drosophila grimshawi TaxID=7222 RepID=UPI0013EF0DA6|nr:uncharacterized protein LOC6566883 [Drosophila grimshawi]